MKHESVKSRELISKFYTFLSCSFSSWSVLGIIFLNILPAMTYGCSPATVPDTACRTASTISITKSPHTAMETLDIFVFRDDEARLLDCYQRVDQPEKWDGRIMSSAGNRIIHICANSRTGKGEWPLIRSMHSLEKISFNLEDESRENPVMTGEAKIPASGPDFMYPGLPYTEIPMSPLTCEIVLRSLICDFKGRPYDGERITDAKVYLTNVNATRRLYSAEGSMPERIINAGFLNRYDLARFRDSSLIIKHIDKSIGKDGIQEDIRLYCYPNMAEEDSPGTPVTRMVIEGKVSGKTYYWPIDISRGLGNGISGGKSYIFDVRITRKGTTDPDIPVRTEEVNITFEEESWIEKEGYTVGF